MTPSLKLGVRIWGTILVTLGTVWVLHGSIPAALALVAFVAALSAFWLID